MHISKHSSFRLKITVGCLTSTYPSIHFSLDEDTLKITVGCLVCVWCVVLLCCGGACVWCVVKLGTLSLSSFQLCIDPKMRNSRSCPILTGNYSLKTLKSNTVGKFFFLLSPHVSMQLLHHGVVVRRSVQQYVARCAPGEPKSPRRFLPESEA